MQHYAVEAHNVKEIRGYFVKQPAKKPVFLQSSRLHYTGETKRPEILHYAVEASVCQCILICSDS